MGKSISSIATPVWEVMRKAEPIAFNWQEAESNHPRVSQAVKNYEQAHQHLEDVAGNTYPRLSMQEAMQKLQQEYAENPDVVAFRQQTREAQAAGQPAPEMPKKVKDLKEAMTARSRILMMRDPSRHAQGWQAHSPTLPDSVRTWEDTARGATDKWHAARAGIDAAKDAARADLHTQAANHYIQQGATKEADQHTFSAQHLQHSFENAPTQQRDEAGGVSAPYFAADNLHSASPEYASNSAAFLHLMRNHKAAAPKEVTYTTHSPGRGYADLPKVGDTGYMAEHNSPHAPVDKSHVSTQFAVQPLQHTRPEENTTTYRFTVPPGSTALHLPHPRKPLEEPRSVFPPGTQYKVTKVEGGAKREDGSWNPHTVHATVETPKLQAAAAPKVGKAPAMPKADAAPMHEAEED